MTFSEHLRIFRRAVCMTAKLDHAFFAAMIGMNLFSGLAPYIPVYFSACLVDAVAAGAPEDTLFFYAALTVGLTFLISLLNNLFSNLYAQSMGSWYRAEGWSYSEKAMELSYRSIEDHDIAKLRTRVQVESQTGFNRWYLHRSISELTYYFCQILTSGIFLLPFLGNLSIAIGWKLLLGAAVLLNLVSVIWTNRMKSRLDMERSEKNVDINQYMNRCGSFINDYKNGQEIRLYGMHDLLASLRRECSDSFNAYLNQDNEKQNLLDILNQVCSHLMKYVVYLILILAALAGRISVGSIAKYVSCLTLLMSAVFGLTKTFQLLAVNNTYLKRYFSYFDIPNTMYQGTLTVEKRDDNEYFVEFSDVSFRYPNTEAYALRHLNYRFKVGQRLAIVGKNGSGKSTFIKLLCRLYDPEEGQILLNGVDIRKYDYDEYLSLFSVVFQDFRLFDFTLGQNVAAAKDFDSEKVTASLEKAGFGERFRKLPDGAETYLNKGYDSSGVEISGGEAQKIALARALYKDAPFIVLDEPTAALDPVSEYEVYIGFSQIAGDKTAIYISHRLASCRFCDRIAVFDHGQIVQGGTHEELLGEKEGLYHSLWEAQAQYYV